MWKLIWSLLVTGTMSLMAVMSFAGEEPVDLDELRLKADSVLNQTDVSGRQDVDVVFQLVDRLLDAGQEEEAKEYIVRGLKLFPWKIEYQMTYAELLAKEGKKEEAEEKAQLVFQYAETQGLIERARRLLGKSPFPPLEAIGPLRGIRHRVVLVPLQKCDQWLVVRLKEELTVALGIPVEIQAIAVTYPPYSRDRRGAILNSIRSQLLEDIENPEIASALQSLGLTKKDLDSEASLLKMVRYLMRAAPREEVATFEAYLDESKGQDPQWDADQLQDVLFRAVEPHRSKNVAYLGITSVDIYANDYNFLFGLANSKGGVMSYCRFTADFNGETPNQKRLVKRTFMQCLASIGHIYGLERCTDPRCARSYPNSLSEHDAKEGILCAQCKEGFRQVFE